MDSDALSPVFAALADPTRRDIVARLADGDATVGELAAPYDVSVQAISKHLRVLEASGLVTRTSDAIRAPRHLEAEVLSLMTKWIDRYQATAEARFRRLDALLEATADEDPQQAASTPTPPPERGTPS
ncbi:MAG: ArsR/SmtB family transcription factor [Pseudoclavibacter sp.]